MGDWYLCSRYLDLGHFMTSEAILKLSGECSNEFWKINDVLNYYHPNFKYSSISISVLLEFSSFIQGCYICDPVIWRTFLLRSIHNPLQGGSVFLNCDKRSFKTKIKSNSNQKLFCNFIICHLKFMKLYQVKRDFYLPT